MKNMHKFYLLLVLVFAVMVTAVPVVAQLTEAFETGLPTTAPTVATDYTLNSGVWTIIKGLRSTTRHGGAYGLRLNSGASGGAAYATAPAQSSITTVTFWARGSGASTLTIQKSVNGGAYTTVLSRSITSTFTSYTVSVNESGGNVRIRFQNSTSQSHYIDDVVINGGTASPALSVSPASLAFGSRVTGTTTQLSYTLSGSALTPASGNVTITAPSGYQVSSASGSGFASSITIAYTGSALSARSIYVNFTPTAIQSYNGNITNAGGGATTLNVAVTGAGTSVPSPSITVSSSSLAFGSVVVNNSSVLSYTLSAANLTPASGNITITAPTAYQVSTSSSSGFASSLPIAYSSSALSARSIYVRFTPTAVQSYSGNVTNAGGGATTQNIAVSGSGVSTPPPPPPSAMIGYATQNGGTTGGAAGPTVTVTNASDFNNYVGSHDPYVVQVQGTIDLGGSQATVRENKTIIGLGTNATINGGLKISHYNNLILRNLTIQGSNNDGLTVQDCRNVWVDHCTFINSSDGQLDIVHASDWVTVSWCKFIYTTNSGHNFANLIGHDDDNSAEDNGKLHVTFHHNWWSTLCIERLPSIRFGRVHLFNNYYNSPGNNYCTRIRINAEALIENNSFENVKNPWEQYVTTAGGTPGKIRAIGNTELNTTWYVNPAPDGDGNQSFLIPGTDVVFAPPYSYTLESGSNVKASVMAGAGPNGLAKLIPEQSQAQLNIPSAFSLNQNYPNPFNPSTIISFCLADAGHVSLKVYDMLGREVASLVDEFRSAGEHQLLFNAARLSSGLYIYRLQAGSMTVAKKMTLMK